MSFPQAIRTCFSKYATFSGRARRKEYWYFILFIFLGSLTTRFVDSVLFGTVVLDTAPTEIAASGDGPVASLFGLLILIPALAAGWRRMHDSGRSGLYVLYPLIIMIGIGVFAGVIGGFEPLLDGNFGAALAGGSVLILGVAFFVLFLSPLLVLWWLAQPSQPGPNAYGPDPRGAT